MMNVHSVSLRGGRNQNEDKHDIKINIGDTDNKLGRINYYGVYDGHGGKEVSQYLFDNLSKYFMPKDVKYPLTKEYVIKIYDHLQNNLGRTEYAYHTGSTALVAVQFKYLNQNYLNILNTGDSRCILCRDNIAVSLTKDHKPSWPEERARIEQIGGKITFDGFDWRIKDLSVSRAFGDIDSTPFVTHRPDIYRYKLDKYDKFFVLACDGLWDVLSNQDVANFVLDYCYDITTNTRINKEINIAKKLGEYAIRKGSGDNITIIVIFLI